MEIKINIGPNIPTNIEASLFKVYVHYYDDDNYHNDDMDDVDRELEHAVRSISSRPRTITEYHRSKLIYEEWMSFLEDKYGGRDIFKLKLKAGIVKEYIPQRPRLKSKRLQSLYDHGVRVYDDKPIQLNMAALDEWVEESRKYLQHDDEIETVRDKKELKKVNDIRYEDMKRSSKRDGYKISSSYSSDVNFIDEYFKFKNIETAKKKSKKKNKKKSKGKFNEKRPRRLIGDYMRGDYLKYVEDTTDTDKDTMAQYGGILLSSAEVEDIAVYQKLNSLGWNSYKIMKNAGFKKKTASRFKVNKGKKKKKRKYEDLVNDAVTVSMGDILNDNGYDSFEDYESDMLNCTWDNIVANYKD